MTDILQYTGIALLFKLFKWDRFEAYICKFTGKPLIIFLTPYYLLWMGAGGGSSFALS